MAADEYIQRKHTSTVMDGHLRYCLDMALINKHGYKSAGEAGFRTIARLATTMGTLVSLHQKGAVRCSQEFIAKRLGKSDRALRTDLKDLKELGLITILKTYNGATKRNANTYIISAHVWIRSTGKALAKKAQEAIAMTIAVASKQAKNLVKFNEYYQEKAKENLLRGKKRFENFLPTDRKFSAALLSSFSKKKLDIKCPPSASAILEIMTACGAQATLHILCKSYKVSFVVAGRLLREAHALSKSPQAG